MHCAFQRLDGQARNDELWLVSTVPGAKREPFRVVARALGRDGSERLALSGRVEMSDRAARLIRPTVTEEYSVSVDGVRQDFVIEMRPAGIGTARLSLELDGAEAETMEGRARLVLADGGRKLAYSRLKATNARGSKVNARLEVLSPHRLVVVLDDALALYPVRIDPTFSDANWIGFGGTPGTSGTVDAAVVDGSGNLCIGGGFTLAADTSASHVAEWNGSSWQHQSVGLVTIADQPAHQSCLVLHRPRLERPGPEILPR